MKKLIAISVTIVLVAIVIALASQTAGAGVIYSNDFESAVGPEWSNTSTDVTPVGDRRFLGQFANDDEVTLSLNDISQHDSITLSFNLYVIQSWDGTNTDYGPDVWQLSTGDGTVLLNTTFSNSGDDGHMQSYPGWYSSGEYDAQTGASEINTLGYDFYGDSVYSLKFTFAHNSSSLILKFAGIGLQDVDDESWGLDNVVITANALQAPEPASMTLFLFGSMALLKKRS